jgi:hypothetical protein
MRKTWCVLIDVRNDDMQTHFACAFRGVGRFDPPGNNEERFHQK